MRNRRGVRAINTHNSVIGVLGSQFLVPFVDVASNDDIPEKSCNIEPGKGIEKLLILSIRSYEDDGIQMLHLECLQLNEVRQVVQPEMTTRTKDPRRREYEA